MRLLPLVFDAALLFDDIVRRHQLESLKTLFICLISRVGHVIFLEP